MKIFPAKEKRFRLLDDQNKTLDRLGRRTEKSESLISKTTDKSFIGKIEGNNFQIISSSMGRGAFCVLEGEIGENGGSVAIVVNRPFKYLLGIFLSLPFLGFIFEIIFLDGNTSIVGIVFALLLQILIIRFFFIGFAFKYLSNESLSRLKDVLDIEWTE